MSRFTMKSLALAVVALGVRLVGLGRQSLWSDELQRVTWAKGYEFDRIFDVVATETGARLPPASLRQALAVVSRHNPPLSGGLLNVWLRLVGDASDFVTRLPSAVLSAACAPILYAALRPRFGDGAGIACGVLVALSPYQILYAQEVNHYAIASFFVAASFYFYFRHEERPALGVGLGWAITSVAALYAHYYAAIVLLFQCVGVVINARFRPMSIARGLWPAALAACTFAPYVPVLQAQMPELTSTAQTGAFQGGPYFFDRLRAILTMPIVGELGNYSIWLASIPILALAVTLSILGMVRAPPSNRVLLVSNVVGPLVFVAFAFFIRRQNSILWPRYQLFFSFASYACMGVALATMSGWRRWTVCLVLAALMFTGIVHQQGILREDWRTAAAAVDRSAAREEPVLVYRQNLVYSLARYLRRDNRLFGIGPGQKLYETLGVIVATSDAIPGIWFASAWPESNDMEGRVGSFLRTHYERCAAAPVNPGVVDLHLTHCTQRKPTTDVSPSWWLRREGPMQEGGWVEVRSSGGVGGWAFSSAGIPTIRVVLDGETIAEAPNPGLERSDVALAFSAYPRELTATSGFFVPARLRDDEIRRVTVEAVRADGSHFALPSDANGGSTR